MLMVLLSATRLDWLQKASSKGMGLTMRILSVMWLNPPLFGCFFHLLLRAGIFVNWMFRMLFSMVFWRRRFTCASLLVLLTLIALSISVAW
jgi:hypothetical protein